MFHGYSIIMICLCFCGSLSTLILWYVFTTHNTFFFLLLSKPCIMLPRFLLTCSPWVTVSNLGSCSYAILSGAVVKLLHSHNILEEITGLSYMRDLKLREMSKSLSFPPSFLLHLPRLPVLFESAGISIESGATYILTDWPSDSFFEKNWFLQLEGLACPKLVGWAKRVVIPARTESKESLELEFFFHAPFGSTYTRIFFFTTH